MDPRISCFKSHELNLGLIINVSEPKINPLEDKVC